MKLTEDDIKALVGKTEFFHLEGTTTMICVMRTVAGFVIVESEACIDPEVFDPAIGSELAYKRALNKLWEMEAYRIVHERNKANIERPSIAVVEKPGIILPS